MENTSEQQFDNSTAEWFIAINDDWVGPLTAAELYAKLQAKEISWAHFIWKKGYENWKKVSEVPPFKSALPDSPSKKLIGEIKESQRPTVQKSSKRVEKSSSPKGDSSKWFLYYNNTQFGPFREEEVNRLLKVAKIHGEIHAWTEGMAGWERLKRIELFTDGVKKADAILKKKSKKKMQERGETSIEMRHDPRKPLLARIMVAHQKQVVVGVCRDISVGGMQILTDKPPAGAGSKIKVNVSPSGADALVPFVAEGVIVRILEDGRGFSFRFDKLSEEAKQAIEKYTEWD